MAVSEIPVKRGRKLDQVLDGARQIFLRVGFDSASMDEVAQAAGVSKATLYSYFRDKQSLFIEVVQQECVRQRDLALEEIDMSLPAPDVLFQVGMRFTSFLTSELGLRIFRISIAEAERFPEIGRSFYESGPGLFRQEMKGYIECACADGQLKVPDIYLAIDQFAELCKAHFFLRLHTGVVREVSQEERQRVVSGAVEMFMARYGA